MNTAKLLKTVRKNKSLSQEEMAKFMGVSQEAICQYEKGKRNIPQHIVDILKAFPPTDNECAAMKYQEGLNDDYINSTSPAALVENAFIAGANWGKATKLDFMDFKKDSEER